MVLASFVWRRLYQNVDGTILNDINCPQIKHVRVRLSFSCLVKSKANGG